MIKDVFILQQDDSIVTNHTWVSKEFYDWDYAIWAELIDEQWFLLVDSRIDLTVRRIEKSKNLPMNWTI